MKYVVPTVIPTKYEESIKYETKYEIYHPKIADVSIGTMKSNKTGHVDVSRFPMQI